MTHIKKIIFFVQAHFNLRDFERFGIRTFFENGFKVEVWDFTAFLTNNEYQNLRIPDPTSWDKVFKFKNKVEALSAISDLEKSVFIIPVIHYNINTYSIFRMLSKMNIPFSSSILSCVVPNSFASKELFINKLRRSTIRNFPDRIFRRIPFEFLGVRAANVILAPAKKYSTSNLPVNNKSHVLWLHSLDYDHYLSMKDSPVYQDTRMGVFVDQYLPFHPDITYIEGNLAKTSPEEYYPILCDFFDFLEEKFKVRIVIAAHPRSKYEEHPDVFGQRDIIRGKTAELIRQSGFVLLHNSIAINYAILFEKPLIFITTDKVNESFKRPGAEGPSIEWLASYFGKKAYNLNNEIDIDLENEMLIDKEVYQSYKNSYIKKDGSLERPYWQVVSDYIKALEWQN
jgi:hypothetical protein